MTRLFAVFMAALLLAAPAVAVNPSERLEDPALEERAREVSKGLRCVVCQNQSIDDSDAELARDMRVVVRERIEAGDSNAEVVSYMQDRYGDYVLLKPPMKPSTYVLWFGPLAVFLAAVGIVVAFYRRSRRGAAAGGPPPLTEEEQKRLDGLLKDREG